MSWHSLYHYFLFAVVIIAFVFVFLILQYKSKKVQNDNFSDHESTDNELQSENIDHNIDVNNQPDENIVQSNVNAVQSPYDLSQAYYNSSQAIYFSAPRANEADDIPYNAHLEK